MSVLKDLDILIIDDAPDERLLLRKLVENYGGRAIEAESVDVGLQLAKEYLPHLIILDLNFSDNSGFNLLETKKNLKEIKEIPLIVFTALSDKASILRALTLGADDYVLKPLRVALLLQKFRKVLRKSSFSRYRFDENKPLPSVTITIGADVTMVSEIGLIIDAPIRLGTEMNIQVSSSILETLECQEVMIRTSMNSGQFSGPCRYTNELNFIGIGETKAKNIRKKIRGFI